MATTFTATLPDGTTATRKSAERTYTHCVARQSSDGTWFAHSWAGRPGLAIAAAAKIGGRAIEATVAHTTAAPKALTKAQIQDALRAAGYYMSGWVRMGRYTIVRPGGDIANDADCQSLTLAEARKLALSLG
ncbi:hypothetical protein S2L_06 [Cyanophage S-2L]|nr:hypothetical protein S2L_06 [Cyanophage S-2L]